MKVKVKNKRTGEWFSVNKGWSTRWEGRSWKPAYHQAYVFNGTKEALACLGNSKYAIDAELVFTPEKEISRTAVSSMTLNSIWKLYHTGKKAWYIDHRYSSSDWGDVEEAKSFYSLLNVISEIEYLAPQIKRKIEIVEFKEEKPQRALDVWNTLSEDRQQKIIGRQKPIEIAKIRMRMESKD